MEKAALDAAFFHYKIDYYYFSGTMQDVFLFVPRRRRARALRKKGAARARQESPLGKVVPLRPSRR